MLWTFSAGKRNVAKCVSFDHTAKNETLISRTMLPKSTVGAIAGSLNPQREMSIGI